MRSRAQCPVCKGNKSRFIMHDKLVCFSCDELLFDMEIELEESETLKAEPALTNTGVAAVQTAKK